MERTRTFLAVILLTCLSVGCASTISVQRNTNNLQELKDEKTISVSTLKCSNPAIAQDIRNVIIEVLLTQYSIVIGGEADVTIKGTITLSSDQVSSKGSHVTELSESGGDYVSEINAQIMKNEKILASATVTQDKNNLSTPDPPEVMGRKIGTKIREILSK